MLLLFNFILFIIFASVFDFYLLADGFLCFLLVVESQLKPFQYIVLPFTIKIPGNPLTM
jgi:hypothetical protein